MIKNKEEYIVKAKNANIETYGAQDELKDKASFYIIWIITVILCVFLKPLSTMIIALLIVISSGLFIILNSKWTLKIKDKRLDIKKGFRSYVIEYKDLINVKKLEVNSYDSPSYSKQNHLQIEFMKEKCYKNIYLPYSQKNMESTILDICQLFITNKELERNPDVSEEYISIR